MPESEGEPNLAPFDTSLDRQSHSEQGTSPLASTSVVRGVSKSSSRVVKRQAKPNTHRHSLVITPVRVPQQQEADASSEDEIDAAARRIHSLTEHILDQQERTHSGSEGTASTIRVEDRPEDPSVRSDSESSEGTTITTRANDRSDSYVPPKVVVFPALNGDIPHIGDINTNEDLALWREQRVRQDFLEELKDKYTRLTVRQFILMRQILRKCR